MKIKDLRKILNNLPTEDDDCEFSRKFPELLRPFESDR